MYFVIETIQQFEQLPIIDECFIQIISGNDHYHPSLSYVSLIYYNDGKKGYIFPIKHSEAFSLELPLIQEFLRKHERVYLIDKKYHSYFIDLHNEVDVNFIHLDQLNTFDQLEYNTLLHEQMYGKFPSLKNINEIISITKHYEKCEELYESVRGYFGLESNLDFQDRFFSAYKKVEESGIRIDLEKFRKKFEFNNEFLSLKKDIVYSYYNLYNLTARPTNSFNGVNFLAIPKDKEFRECFIPRNNLLVEFDFDAYHLRLIGNLIGYKWAKESIHQILGRQYFKKDEISSEEYLESKSITFKQLYGGVEKQYRDIEFFAKLHDYTEDLWKSYKRQCAISLPTGRILNFNSTMNKLKLFNYVVQNLETKENVYKIEKIFDLINKESLKTKLILITYDSFLFDFDILDGKQTLLKIKEILEENDMIVKHKYGNNYAF